MYPLYLYCRVIQVASTGQCEVQCVVGTGGGGWCLCSAGAGGLGGAKRGLGVHGGGGGEWR